MTEDDAHDLMVALEVAALTALAEANVPPDIQGLLIGGNPNMDIAPGALGKVVEAVIKYAADYEKKRLMKDKVN